MYRGKDQEYKNAKYKYKLHQQLRQMGQLNDADYLYAIPFEISGGGHTHKFVSCYASSNQAKQDYSKICSRLKRHQYGVKIGGGVTTPFRGGCGCTFTGLYKLVRIPRRMMRGGDEQKVEEVKVIPVAVEAKAVEVKLEPPSSETQAITLYRQIMNKIFDIGRKVWDSAKQIVDASARVARQGVDYVVNTAKNVGEAGVTLGTESVDVAGKTVQRLFGVARDTVRDTVTGLKKSAHKLVESQPDIIGKSVRSVTATATDLAHKLSEELGSLLETTTSDVQGFASKTGDVAKSALSSVHDIAEQVTEGAEKIITETPRVAENIVGKAQDIVTSVLSESSPETPKLIPGSTEAVRTLPPTTVAQAGGKKKRAKRHHKA